MKIKELNLPVRVKMNNYFNLDESVDKNTIVYIYKYEDDDDDCYKVFFKLLKSDYEYNFAISKRNWYDKNGDAVLNYFEANTLQKDSDGNFLDTFYVMGDENCFDLIDNEKSHTTSEVKEKFFKFVNDVDVLNLITDKEKLNSWLDSNL